MSRYQQLCEELSQTRSDLNQATASDEDEDCQPVSILEEVKI